MKLKVGWVFVPFVFCPLFLYALPSSITLKNGHEYRLKEKLGRGGFGGVFEASSSAYKFPVAVKLFTLLEDYDAEVASKKSKIFYSQAKEFFIPVLDKGKIQNPSRYVGAIVMPKVDGVLSNVVSDFCIGKADGTRVSLTEREFLRNARNIFSLAYQMLKIWVGLASNQLIHGDLSLQNLGFNKNPFQLKVLDFGTMTTGPLANHNNHFFAFDKDYSSPELMRYNFGTLHNVSLSSYNDFYSLGKILQKLLCNNCSWRNLNKLLNRWRRHLAETQPYQVAFAGLAFVKDFIYNSTQKNPLHRYMLLARQPFSNFIRFDKPKNTMHKTAYFFLYPRLVAEPEEVLRHYLEFNSLLNCSVALSPQ